MFEAWSGKMLYVSVWKSGKKIYIFNESQGIFFQNKVAALVYYILLKAENLNTLITLFFATKIFATIIFAILGVIRKN